MAFLNTPIISSEPGQEGRIGADSRLDSAKYTRVLVPLDGSPLAERVLPYARVLAKGFGAPVELLSVFSPAPGGPADHGYGRYPHQIDANYRAEALDY
ncbi:MAG: universal stress protein, partial [Dehalococcoidia bacterium]